MSLVFLDCLHVYQIACKNCIVIICQVRVCCHSEDAYKPSVSVHSFEETFPHWAAAVFCEIYVLPIFANIFLIKYKNLTWFSLRLSYLFKITKLSKLYSCCKRNFHNNLLWFIGIVSKSDTSLCPFCRMAPYAYLYLF